MGMVINTFEEKDKQDCLNEKETGSPDQQITMDDPFEREEDCVPAADVVQKEFDADVKQLHDVLAFMEEELEKRDGGMKKIMEVTLAMEEAFVNVAHYAYEGISEKGKALVSMAFEGDEVKVTLIDNGMEFDPLAKEDPDVTEEAKYRQIGGLGIFMIKKLMDSVMYERKDGHNILTMRKIFR